MQAFIRTTVIMTKLIEYPNLSHSTYCTSRPLVPFVLMVSDTNDIKCSHEYSMEHIVVQHLCTG